MYWMTLPLKRYFDFRGRSRRKEYWLFTLFLILASIVLGILDGALGLTFGGGDEDTPFGNSNGVLGSIFSLATFIPSISVGVRRLHDIDRTGWWLLFPVLTVIVGAFLTGVMFGFSGGDGLAGLGGALLGVVLGAVIGGLVLFVFTVTDGTPGPNRYGDDLKDPVGNVAEVFR